MEDKAEILWRMCNEHYTQGRHHETQRSTVSQFILAIAGALVAFCGSQGATLEGKRFIAIFLIFLGVFGALFSQKQYERFKFHMKAASLHKSTLEDLTYFNLSELRKEAEEQHRLKFPKMEKISLNWFWTGMHILIAILGLCLLIS